LKNFENFPPAIGGWCRIALNDDECLILETDEDFFIVAADVVDVELVVLDAIDDVLVDENRLRYALVSGAMGVVEEGSLLFEMRREEIVFLEGTHTPLFVLLLLDLLVKHDFVDTLSVAVVIVDLLGLPATKRLRYLLWNLFDFSSFLTLGPAAAPKFVLFLFMKY
jgi:hypothetical protein